VVSDRAHVFCDRPLVVVEHDDETLGMRFHIVERFVADSTGERGIACDYDNVFIATAQISSHSHAETSGERRASMTGAVSIVFAFRAQKNSVEAAELAHRVEALEASRKHLVHIALVADVHDDTVTRSLEHAMQSNRQLSDSKVRSEMAAGLREDFDQLIAHFLRELRQILFTKRFDVGWRTDSIEQTLRHVCPLSGLRIFRRV